MADVTVCDPKNKCSKSQKSPKKRTRNPEEWHKQKQKRLRIAGKAHINTNGKLVAEKIPGGDCLCRRKCFLKVPEPVRLKTFEGFYSMKTHDEQNAYLFGLMRQIDIKRKRKKDSSRRTCTFEYFIRVRGREIQVCQTAFKNIHAITERKVRVLCKKMDDGVMFPSDNRGKNSGKRAGEIRLAPQVIEQIKDHIFSIVHTHRLKDFIRVDKVTGLEINVSKMWKDYITVHDPTYIFVTQSKNKRIIASEPTINCIPNIQQEVASSSGNETYHSLTYPGSGHLINIAENYFAQAMVTQASYPAQHLSVSNYLHADKMSFYQQGQVVVQPGPVHPATSHAHPHPHPDTNTYVIVQSVPSMPAELIKTEVHKEQKLHDDKKEQKKGPMVKQWRYTNIFHEEIKGSALGAIKTRLNMYYSEEQVNKKKAKMGLNKQPSQMQQIIQ